MCRISFGCSIGQQGVLSLVVLRRMLPIVVRVLADGTDLDRNVPDAGFMKQGVSSPVVHAVGSGFLQQGVSSPVVGVLLDGIMQ